MDSANDRGQRRLFLTNDWGQWRSFLLTHRRQMAGVCRNWWRRCLRVLSLAVYNFGLCII